MNNNEDVELLNSFSDHETKEIESEIISPIRNIRVLDNAALLSPDDVKDKFFSNYRDKEFRPGQIEAIEFIVESEKRIIVIEGPTGSGKSLVGAVAGKMLHFRDKLHRGIIYLVQTKALQEQIIQDFPYPEFKILKGRANYLCGADKTGKTTADNCIARKCIPECQYNKAKEETLKHDMRILNYSYYFTETNFVGRFSGIPNLICDEADCLENVLTNFISLTITQRMSAETGLKMPKYKTTSSEASIPEWKAWAKDAVEIVKDILYDLKSSIWTMQPGSTMLLNAMKKKKILERMMFQLKLFVKYVDDTWLQMEQHTNRGTKWVFTPTWLTEDITNEFFTNHAPGKIVLMSATFPPINILAKTLGIKKQDIDYISIPSTFNPDKRKIYIQSAGDLSYKNFKNDIGKITDKIEEILKLYPDRKGLIHCISYKLNQEVMNIGVKNPELKNRLITHEAANRNEILDKFKKSNEPLVLVSPSMERGISLNDDLARFIIIAKAPFESLADKKVSTRLYSSGGLGKLWYKSIAIQTMIQMAGRGTRSIDDYCDVYIIEAQAKKLLFDNIQLLPDHFKNSIQ